jgi:hypothetical protein
MNRRLLAVIIYFSLMRATEMLGQGAAVVMPMSHFVFSKDETISFQVHNQLNDSLVLGVDHKCEVDGVELDRTGCAKYFSLQFDVASDGSKIELPKEGSVKGVVSLISTPLRYALFKPLMAPPTGRQKAAEGVSFEFKYQPGYLFIINPDKAELKMPVVSNRMADDQTFSKFEFDLKILSMPAVASLSAKIMDMKSKKMLRFARLASEKILDPTREKIVLEAGYNSVVDPSYVCFEFIIQWVSTRSLQKLTDCK